MILLLFTDGKNSILHKTFNVYVLMKRYTSLNLPTQPEIDRLWVEDAERRIAQIDKGEVKLVPGKKVFSNIRKKYRR